MQVGSKQCIDSDRIKSAVRISELLSLELERHVCSDRRATYCQSDRRATYYRVGTEQSKVDKDLVLG